MLLSLNRLKWVAIALPIAFIVFLRLTTERLMQNIGRLETAIVEEQEKIEAATAAHAAS